MMTTKTKKKKEKRKKKKEKKKTLYLQKYITKIQNFKFTQ
jgi:hypothetical protein